MKSIFEVVVGSYFHGTATSGSDVDWRTLYQLSLRERLSLFSEPTYFSKKGSDHEFYELSHFAKMLAKGNVTAVEVAVAAIDQGYFYPASALLSLSLDTKRFTSQANGFIKGMWNAGTPKSLHHGWRVSLLLRRYLLTGELGFDCTSYPEFDDLMRVKVGLLMPPKGVFEYQEPSTIWHTSDLDKLDEMVYTLYTEKGA